MTQRELGHCLLSLQRGGVHTPECIRVAEGWNWAWNGYTPSAVHARGGRGGLHGARKAVGMKQPILRYQVPRSTLRLVAVALHAPAMGDNRSQGRGTQRGARRCSASPQGQEGTSQRWGGPGEAVRALCSVRATRRDMRVVSAEGPEARWRL